MTKEKTIDLKNIIGVCPLCNTITVLVHAIDYAEDKILTSINWEEPCWCDITEKYMEYTGATELGFMLGSLFIPLYEIKQWRKNNVEL